MKVFNFIVLFFITSCGSVYTMKVTSTPDQATVYARNVGSNKRVEIGKTPFNSTVTDLRAKNFQDGPMIFEVEKEGHQNAQIFVSESTANIDISVELKKLDTLAETKKFDKVGSELFEVHRLIRNKKYVEAHKMLDEIKLFPSLSIVHELEGSVFYLEKKFNQSLDSFRTAYRFNGENLFALKMKRFLEKKLNIKDNQPVAKK